VQCLYRTAVSGRVAVHTSERRVEPAVWLPSAVPGVLRVLYGPTQIPRNSTRAPGFRYLSLGYEPRLI
jgi:hypothetical protein